MSVGISQGYLAQDYSVGSDAHRNLVAMLDDEAGSDVIKLTDLVGQDPAHLTPAMLQWFATFVAGTRQEALDRVESHAGTISKQAGAAGLVLERELDAIEDRRLVQKRKVKAAHYERHRAEAEKLAHLEADAQRARRQYDNLHAQHNRSPKQVPVFYLPVLVIILVAESMINFESFLAVKIMTPATALGSVVVLGIVLALAAHIHGKLLRQAAVLFDPSQNDRDRLVGLRMLTLGTTGLAVVLGAVAYARGIYLQDQIRFEELMGGKVPTWIETVGGSMLGNVAVWIGGVLISFLVHDPDPRFPEALEARDTLSAKALRLKVALQVPLQREFERIDATAKRDVETAHTRDASLTHLPEYQDLRREMARLVAQDQKVLGLLQAYRGGLVSRVRGRNVTFLRPSPLGTDEPEMLPPAEYAAVQLRLKFL